MKFRDAKHLGTGDIIIQENNINVGKPLVQCSNEELVDERKFRNQRLLIERDRRKTEKKPFVIISIAVLILGFIYGCYKVGNLSDILTWLYAIPGAIFSIVSFQNYSTPNQFEQKHQQALREIADILRERGKE
ncbi:hypothetical protein A4G16_03980 [Mannheimia granulomatis]|uniref:Uncharacterized protein n=1 Tax=Mannheimia granulomatis TaxID=85402 RepID=A0A6G8JHN7_9PAST|nr:hypothetical protein [Mannheimia granulomatis]QIM66586.1 hypothetical protein A4G16_03980 [Mannheimia granulomatis]